MIVLQLLALGAGALVGSLAALLTRAVYPMLLVPAAMAVVVGAALGIVLYAFDVRSRAAALCAVLLGWLAMVTAFHWVEYRVGFVEAVRAFASVDAPSAGDPRANADDLLEAATGERGFGGFLKLRVTAGARLRLWRGLGSPDWLAGLVWALDLLLALAVLGLIVRRVRARLVVPGQGEQGEVPR